MIIVNKNRKTYNTEPHNEWEVIDIIAGMSDVLKLRIYIEYWVSETFWSTIGTYLPLYPNKWPTYNYISKKGEYIERIVRLVFDCGHPIPFEDWCCFHKNVIVSDCGENWKEQGFAGRYQMRFGGIYQYFLFVYQHTKDYEYTRKKWHSEYA